MKVKLDFLWNKKLYVILDLRVLERGSRGPSTVTLIALEYVATCVGEPATEIVNVKLFPVIKMKESSILIFYADVQFSC